MADKKPNDNTSKARNGAAAAMAEPSTPRGPLRALYDWLVRPTPTPQAPGETGTRPASRDGIPARIGKYAIVRKLGQGGMGIVYEARDDQLERTVALKTLSSVAPDETARRRFWREARAAASVNHPNVCQLYEIGEDNGELFIAMELLQGESLSDRLQRGPLNVTEALPVGLGVLAALGALHERGIVHRDLKPSNVFLTPHGAKLLDFGLARPTDASLADALKSGSLTHTGMVVGTPRYMAPEQVTGEGLDARSDLFSVGAILFEMLAGRPAFAGRNVVEILHATLYEQPPALTGSPAVSATDRVVRRALAKHPGERFDSAERMADELRTAAGAVGNDTPAVARALTRLVVLPFRVLRADTETDFLAYSLADAIATSLSGVGSLVVRSSVAAARFTGESPDLKALAAEADVDLVVMGTLLRAGDQLRVAAQLVEAPSGTLVASHTVQAALGDLFRLQDDLTRRVVEALSLPLVGRGAWPTPDTPHDARAYELYLRANELARNYEQLPEARELYQQCLDLDPSFAPAWAHLGRCHRVIGKYIDGSASHFPRAEQAFRRALELNPRLSVAHKYYANLQADTGHATQALVRLLDEATRRPNDPELFAGLVHASRYCGLFDVSIAAHNEARRLDPNVPTSVEQTFIMTGDIERLLVVADKDDTKRVVGLGLAGRREEARAALDALRDASPLPAFRQWTDWLASWLDQNPSEMIARMSAMKELKVLEDPEALFQNGWLLCEIGQHESGLDHVRRGVEKGYNAAPTLARARDFDAVRTRPEFVEVLRRADAGRRAALSAFREAGGERLLGAVLTASAVA
jgi:serine/threonine protein kinase/tetratricopeptide (TPR) repeat protein